MPQEIVIPVLSVREKEGSAAEATKARPVNVQILGTSFKVTTNRHRFQIIQTEPIGQRILPLKATVGIYDGETAVSTVETLTFDTASNDLTARTKYANLSLKSQSYDKRKTYHLVVRNADDSIEIHRVEVAIDLAFSNDF